MNINNKKWKKLPHGIHVSIFCHVGIATYMHRHQKNSCDMSRQLLLTTVSMKDQKCGWKILGRSFFEGNF